MYPGSPEYLYTLQYHERVQACDHAIKALNLRPDSRKTFLLQVWLFKGPVFYAKVKEEVIARRFDY